MGWFDKAFEPSTTPPRKSPRGAVSQGLFQGAVS
jgi:hypothetical protein